MLRAGASIKMLAERFGLSEARMRQLFPDHRSIRPPSLVYERLRWSVLFSIDDSTHQCLEAAARAQQTTMADVLRRILRKQFGLK